MLAQRAGDIQTEAAATRIGGEERFEGLLGSCLVEPRTVVADLEIGTADAAGTAAAQGDPGFAAVRGSTASPRTNSEMKPWTDWVNGSVSGRLPLRRDSCSTLSMMPFTRPVCWRMISIRRASPAASDSLSPSS